MSRFPLIPTVTFLIAFAILCGLGVWQLKRKVWKEHLLAQIAGLEHAPAKPLAEVLEQAKRGADVEFARVDVDCAPPDPPQGHASLYGTHAGGVGWRALAPCRIEDAPWPMIVIDRGFETASGDAVRPQPLTYPPPRHVVGVVRRIAPPNFAQRSASYAENDEVGYQLRQHAVAALAARSGLAAAPVVVVAEHEDPAVKGLEPAAVPADIPNRHFEYALTWFGLALGLLGVYVGMMFTRLRRSPTEMTGPWA